MTKLLVEWLWRIALLGALLWIGWELNEIHQDMTAPLEEAGSVAIAPDDVDLLREDIATLDEKVTAVMAAMLQLRR